jgi:hypothetical protein
MQLSVLIGVLLLQVFTTRGLEQMAANADALRQQVQEFKALVPLVQVSASVIAGSIYHQHHLSCMHQHLQ